MPICFLFIAGALVLSGCSVKNLSKQAAPAVKPVENVPAVANTSAPVQPSAEVNTPPVHVSTSSVPVNKISGKVLTDTVHGVIVNFPTDYAFSQGTPGRIYFGPKLAANVCKDEANGCSDNVALENANGYNYALDFTPARSVSAIFKDLTLSSSSDGKIEYDNRNGEAPQTEKINGHDVVSYWTGGEGDSPYTMEVVGTKYNYVFQAEDQKLTEAEMQSDYNYIRSVIKNMQFLQ